MDRNLTPPPGPRRLRTPPAPLHGAQHDSYEPYSPRRSTRTATAAQRQEALTVPSPTRSRIARKPIDGTPKSRKPARTSLHGISSPPASPVSPEKRSARATQTHQPALALYSDDSDAPANSRTSLPTPARRLNYAMAARNMLPTPHKTPRKHKQDGETAHFPTARVLFPNRPTSIEDAMPTSRKGRRDMTNPFSSMTEEESDEIAIHVDASARIPSADEDDGNPFVSRSRRSTRTRAPPRNTVPPRMREAADREEGIIYMFRGKKVFRPYADGPSQLSDGAPDFSDEEVRHQAGSTARRPITRSSVKPRKLFEAEIKQRRQIHPQDTDEEAETEIEPHIATPSARRTRKIDVFPAPQEALATPPTTVRKTRQISFDSWTRVKSSSGSSRAGDKRPGTPLEGPSRKHTRTDAS